MKRSRPFFTRNAKCNFFPDLVESKADQADPKEHENVPLVDGGGREELISKHPDSKLQDKDDDNRREDPKKDHLPSVVMESVDKNANNTVGLRADVDEIETSKYKSVVGARAGYEEVCDDLNLVLGSEDDSDEYVPPKNPGEYESSEDDSDEFTSPKKRRNTSPSKKKKNNTGKEAKGSKKQKGKNETGKEDKGSKNKKVTNKTEEDKGHLEKVVVETKVSNSVPSSRDDVPPAPGGDQDVEVINIDGPRDYGSQNVGSGCVISVTAGEIRTRVTSHQVVPRSGVIATSGVLGSGKVPTRMGKYVAVPRKTDGSKGSSKFALKSRGRYLSGVDPLKSDESSPLTRIAPRATGGSILPAASLHKNGEPLAFGAPRHKIGKSFLPKVAPLKTGGSLGSGIFPLENGIISPFFPRKTGSSVTPAVAPHQAGGLLGSAVVPRKTGGRISSVVAPHKIGRLLGSGEERGRLCIPGEATAKTMEPASTMGLGQTQGGADLPAGSGESLGGGGYQQETGDEQDVKEECRLEITRHLSRSLEKSEKENKRLRRLLREVKRPMEEFKCDETEEGEVEVVVID